VDINFLGRTLFRQILRVFILGIFAAHWGIALAANEEKASTSYGVNRPQGKTYQAFPRVSTQQLRVVFYRSPQTKVDGVVSVFINDKYHTSLQSGAYSAICLTTFQLQLRTRVVTHGQALRPELEATTKFYLPKGRSHFLRLIDDETGRTHIEPVNEDIALTELRKTREQKHTINRVAHTEPCKEPDRGSPEEENFVVTIATDAIFGIGKTQINAISKKLQDELDHVAQKLSTQYQPFAHKQVLIIGHADDGKNEEENEKISKERAQAIKSYLVQKGVPLKDIVAEGMGSKDHTKTQTLSKRRVDIDAWVELN
jgi:outer membrane protein OmpA-like peptidoglycan-associated protein